MDKEDGLAAVQFLHDRYEGGIAEVFGAVAGHHADALGFQGVKAVGDFLQRVIRVGHRQSGEHAEAALVVGDHAGLIFVAIASKGSCLIVIAEEDAGIAGGDDGRGHAGGVHRVERFL